MQLMQRQSEEPLINWRVVGLITELKGFTTVDVGDGDPSMSDYYKVLRVLLAWLLTILQDGMTRIYRVHSSNKDVGLG